MEDGYWMTSLMVAFSTWKEMLLWEPTERANHG